MHGPAPFWWTHCSSLHSSSRLLPSEMMCDIMPLTLDQELILCMLFASNIRFRRDIWRTMQYTEASLYTGSYGRPNLACFCLCKGYFVRTQLIHYHVAYGCFYVTVAELSICNRDCIWAACKAETVCYLILYSKNLWTLGWNHKPNNGLIHIDMADREYNWEHFAVPFGVPQIIRTGFSLANLNQMGLSRSQLRHIYLIYVMWSRLVACGKRTVDMLCFLPVPMEPCTLTTESKSKWLNL